MRLTAAERGRRPRRCASSDARSISPRSWCWSRSCRSAHLRFSVIGQLLAAPSAKGEVRPEIEALSARAWRHPTTGEPIHFGSSISGHRLATTRCADYEGERSTGAGVSWRARALAPSGGCRSRWQPARKRRTRCARRPRNPHGRRVGSLDRRTFLGCDRAALETELHISLIVVQQKKGKRLSRDDPSDWW